MNYEDMTIEQLLAALDAIDQERLAAVAACREKAKALRAVLTRKMALADLASAENAPHLKRLRARAGVAEINLSTAGTKAP